MGDLMFIAFGLRSAKIFNFLHLTTIPRLKMFPLVNNSAPLPVTVTEDYFYTCQHLCV